VSQSGGRGVRLRVSSKDTGNTRGKSPMPPDLGAT
jgi:hypothetical protein